MRIITKKIARKANADVRSFLVMSKLEWLDIGKKAGFIKTQAKGSAMKAYMDKMEFINDILSQKSKDGTVTITDKEVLDLAHQITGNNFEGKQLSDEMVRSLRSSISNYLKQDLGVIPEARRKLKRKEMLGEPPSDIGEQSLLEQLKKTEEPEDSQIVDSAQAAEVSTEIEEGKAEELAIEKEELEREKRKSLQKKKNKDIAGAVHPVDLFDESVDVSTDGSSTISNESVLKTIKTVTGEDYSGVQLSPETVSNIRSQLVEYFKPKVSNQEENGLEELETALESSPVEAPQLPIEEETELQAQNPSEIESPTEEEDQLPAAPPVIPPDSAKDKEAIPVSSEPIVEEDEGDETVDRGIQDIFNLMNE